MASPAVTPATTRTIGCLAMEAQRIRAFQAFATLQADLPRGLAAAV